MNKIICLISIIILCSISPAFCETAQVTVEDLNNSPVTEVKKPDVNDSTESSSNDTNTNADANNSAESTSPDNTNTTPDVNDSTDVATDSSDNDSNDSDSSITKEDAIKEAKSQLKEPGAVKDLTNPGVVYTQLSEGVSAWIASLDGNRDQFGNEITSSYVSATRPDFVPASLQTFLLNYYKDNNEINLAFGLDGVQAATKTVQDSYNNSVTKLADEIMAAGNSDSDSDDSDDSDNSEDVPELDNDDDSDDDSDNNDDNDDDNDDSSNDATDVASLEDKYKIDLQSGDKDFSAQELKAVDEALGFLPSKFYSPRELNPPEAENPTPARIKRVSSINYKGQTAFGLFKSKPPAHLEVSDAAWEMAAHDYPTPPFTEQEGHEAQFGGTIVHEMTHRHIATDDNGNYIRDMADKPIIRDWAGQFGWSSSGGQWSVSDPSTCVTKYAGMANPEEDLAESVMMYIYWPNKLKHVNQAKYDFIKNSMGISESGKSHPYPPE